MTGDFSDQIVKENLLFDWLLGPVFGLTYSSLSTAISLAGDSVFVLTYSSLSTAISLSGDPVFVLVHSPLSTAFSLSGGAVFGLPALVWLSP